MSRTEIEAECILFWNIKLSTLSLTGKDKIILDCDMCKYFAQHGTRNIFNRGYNICHDTIHVWDDHSLISGQTNCKYLYQPFYLNGGIVQERVGWCLSESGNNLLWRWTIKKGPAVNIEYGWFTILTLQWTWGFTATADTDFYLEMLQQALAFKCLTEASITIRKGQGGVTSSHQQSCQGRFSVLITPVTLNTLNIKFYWQPQQHWYPSQQLQWNAQAHAFKCFVKNILSQNIGL